MNVNFTEKEWKEILDRLKGSLDVEWPEVDISIQSIINRIEGRIGHEE
jgi:hypothetical protein